ncbi:hypothetical protein [uncultured Chryseobacterium sp.]|uniref:hypothetical protein n=1 Tax=uncultured Chryseobacterium sp. TaxID=259322 RepID=UPI0025DEFCFF|nr:hypothetical protein [uncultured Chryseobacterium sp.]
MNNKELALKQKQITQYKNILSTINVMIVDNNLPFIITMFPNTQHENYEVLKKFLVDETDINYKEFLPHVDSFFGNKDS